ncbi:hypothetical protein [Nocardia asiatica]
MLLLTSSEAARIIADRTGFHPGLKWMRTMVTTGILTDHGPGVHHRFDADELAEFLATHPYRPTLPFAYLGVSVTELAESPAFELAPPQNRFRDYAGYDHRNRAGLTPLQRARAIVSTWRIGHDTAHDVVERGLPLIGCVKGVITPDTIYWPRAVVRLVGGIGFDVDPDRRGHPEIGSGAITDVRPGNIWRLVEPSTATP